MWLGLGVDRSWDWHRHDSWISHCQVGEKMRVNTKYIRDVGARDRERVVLEVTEQDDIGNYILARSRYTDDRAISSDLENVFWLPDTRVKLCDLVVIYTKNGRNRSQKDQDGTSSHFFYWGLPNPIWEDEDTVPVLMRIHDWQQRRKLRDT
jgi:hypothetical protein